MNDSIDISKNLNIVRKKVKDACSRSGRKYEDILILAVSKTMEPGILKEAYDAGVRDFGENKVQEFLDKYEAFKETTDINWHLIGHLQTNKVKYLPGKTFLIHSLDSIKLAEEIDSRMGKENLSADVLVQINVAKEESKFGIYPEDAMDFIYEAAKFKNIKIKGLMTIAPDFEDREQVRPVFRRLFKIFVDTGSKNIDNVHMKYLSMGMSKDFEIAIEEGANIIRVGTGIFGKRVYK